jgi:hypothetical protein
MISLTKSLLMHLASRPVIRRIHKLCLMSLQLTMYLLNKRNNLAISKIMLPHSSLMYHKLSLHHHLKTKEDP